MKQIELTKVLKLLPVMDFVKPLTVGVFAKPLTIVGFAKRWQCKPASSRMVNNSHFRDYTKSTVIH